MPGLLGEGHLCNDGRRPGEPLELGCVLVHVLYMCFCVYVCLYVCARRQGSGSDVQKQGQVRQLSACPCTCA